MGVFFFLHLSEGVRRAEHLGYKTPLFSIYSVLLVSLGYYSFHNHILYPSIFAQVICTSVITTLFKKKKKNISLSMATDISQYSMRYGLVATVLHKLKSLLSL